MEVRSIRNCTNRIDTLQLAIRGWRAPESRKLWLFYNNLEQVSSFSQAIIRQIYTLADDFLLTDAKVKVQVYKQLLSVEDVYRVLGCRRAWSESTSTSMARSKRLLLGITRSALCFNGSMYFSYTGIT
jgi:hypothetical protein